jgi:hypothetical protein
VDPEPLIGILPDGGFDDVRKILSVYEDILLPVARPDEFDFLIGDKPVAPVIEPERIAGKHRRAD